MPELGSCWSLWQVSLRAQVRLAFLAEWLGWTCSSAETRRACVVVRIRGFFQVSPQGSDLPSPPTQRPLGSASPSSGTICETICALSYFGVWTWITLSRLQKRNNSMKGSSLQGKGEPEIALQEEEDNFSRNNKCHDSRRLEYSTEGNVKRTMIFELKSKWEEFKERMVTIETQISGL